MRSERESPRTLTASRPEPGYSQYKEVSGIKIEVKHKHRPEAESITLFDSTAAWAVYKHLLCTVVYNEENLDYIALRNPEGEIVSKCSF